MSIIDISHNPKEDKAMSNLATVKTNEISLEGASALRDSIKEGLALVSKGYLAITPDVAKLYDCKGYKALGYKNFDEMCTMEFAMSHGTTVGIRKVFDKFGSVTKENKYLIPDKYMEFGYTKLLLFTDKKFEETGINPIEEFTPDMTIAQMKDALKLRLEEKAEKQDKTAIDTTATEATEATATEATEEVTEVTEATEEVTAKSIIDNMLADSKTLAKLMSDLKPEKKVLIEAIEANLKELRKLAK